MTKYVFSWKNNEKRKELYGKIFRVVSWGRFNSCKVEFEDGHIEIISRNALRKCLLQKMVGNHEPTRKNEKT